MTTRHFFRLKSFDGSLERCVKTELRANDIYFIVDVTNENIDYIIVRQALDNPVFNEEKQQWEIDSKPLFFL